jgi:hypothetical protein
MNLGILRNVDALELKALTQGALDDLGALKVMPKDFYAQFHQETLSAFCLQQGCYALPTIELLNLINLKIMEVSPSRNAIEIGSGNGVIGQALGITCTDSWMQEDPAIKAHYAQVKQPTVPYGRHVVRLDAHAAVDHYRPEVVVAAWVTHRYNPLEHERGGNAWGVDEYLLLEQIKRYVFVGNLKTHENKPLLAQAHEVIQGDFLFSRSLSSDQCALLIWEGGRK